MLGVRDFARSHDSHHRGLGFSTSGTPADGIIFFQISGICPALYPFEKLAEDVGITDTQPTGGFSGITLSHNARTKSEVAALISRAKQVGAIIEKSAQDTFWGGHSGYVSDPDGYL